MRTICPSCRGGVHSEESLSITRNEGLVWQCFRAKCGVKGATNGVAFSSSNEEKQIKKATPTWEGKTYDIPPKVAEQIQSLWGLSDVPNWYWTTEFGGRIAMSVRSPKDLHRGWVLRALSSTVRTKALTYLEKGEGLSWYKTQPHTGTVLVEDIPSAIRASRYVNAVALLGTGIGLTRAAEIAEHAPRPITVALDQDATALSFRWAHKYKLLWDTVKVLPLTKDIKNMTEDDVCRMFT